MNLLARAAVPAAVYLLLRAHLHRIGQHNQPDVDPATVTASAEARAQAAWQAVLESGLTPDRYAPDASFALDENTDNTPSTRTTSSSSKVHLHAIPVETTTRNPFVDFHVSESPGFSENSPIMLPVSLPPAGARAKTHGTLGRKPMEHVGETATIAPGGEVGDDPMDSAFRNPKLNEQNCGTWTGDENFKCSIENDEWMMVRSEEGSSLRFRRLHTHIVRLIIADTM